MDENETVIDHLNVYNTMVSQITFVGIKMDEEDKCITLLCSLPDSWDNLIVAIGSCSQVTLKFDEIVSSLLSKEKRRKTMDNHSMDAQPMRVAPRRETKINDHGEDLNIRVDINP